MYTDVHIYIHTLCRGRSPARIPLCAPHLADGLSPDHLCVILSHSESTPRIHTHTQTHTHTHTHTHTLQPLDGLVQGLEFFVGAEKDLEIAVWGNGVGEIWVCPSLFGAVPGAFRV
jgi:hypothetical protein